MISFLVVVGLTLFICGAAMYIAHAARHDPRMIAGSVLLPVVIPVYYRKHWDELQVAGLLQSSGLVMALAGGLALAFEPSPHLGKPGDDASVLFSSLNAPNLASFVESDEAISLLARQSAGTRASGRLHGEAFVPDRVEYIDGVLRLSEGEGFVPEREIAIDFGSEFADADRVKKLVAPATLDAPAVHLTWKNADGTSETETILRGYRLDVLMQHSSRDRMSGYIQLTLPDPWESYLSGDLEIATSHLRYRGGEVDLAFDHEDTVAYVAEQFLLTQYNREDVDRVSFSGLAMDTLEGRASATARVALKDGRVGMHALKLARSEFGWGVLAAESAAATEAAGYKPVYNVMPTGEEGAAAPARVVERPRRVQPQARVVEERVMAFADLGTLSGQGAIVEYRDGRTEKGVLRGVSKDRLVVEALKGGGTVQFRVQEGELARLRMNDGSVVRMPGVAAGASSSGNSAGAPGQQQVVMAGDVDVTRFLNRYVRIVSTDGKTTLGVFRGVNRDRLVVGTLVRGGNVDYMVPVAQLQSIDFASP